MPLPLLLSSSEFSYFPLSSPLLRLSMNFGPVDMSAFFVKQRNFPRFLISFPFRTSALGIGALFAETCALHSGHREVDRFQFRIEQFRQFGRELEQRRSHSGPLRVVGVDR